MSHPIIRLLSDRDLDGAFALSATAGWNQRLSDWRMLLQIAPAGGVAALANGQIVGTAIGIDYGGFGWIAMMLVDPACRGRGIGRALLEAALAALPPGVPVRLDATPMGRPLYQRYGFEDETTLTRYVNAAATPLEVSARVRQMTAADLKSVREHDHDVFAGQRDPVLAWALDSAPQYGLVASSAEPLAGYCLGRQGRLFDQIGPVVASDDAIALALVSAALSAAGGRPVVVDAFDARGIFTTSLRGFGFEAQRPLYRMCRRTGREPAEPASLDRRHVEFAILGPEFA